MIEQAIRRIIEGQDLERAEMAAVFGEVMDGRATDVQKSALLVALRMKGETAEEITGAAMAMRERVTPLSVDGDRIVDTCGTSPSTSWADPLATTSEARLDSNPNPPTTGNISPATTTLASRQHQASLITVTVMGGLVGGCSGMRTE